MTTNLIAQAGIALNKLNLEVGLSARNRSCDLNDHSLQGALAALESFYYGFNNRNLNTIRSLWLNNELVQLNNPVGGIVRDLEEILAVYEKLFNGNVRVWVNFTDIVYYGTSDFVVFAGTEIGEFSSNGQTMQLKFRTSRCFGFMKDEKRWYQLHHHGSIDDADLLLRYQTAVRPEHPGHFFMSFQQPEI